MTVDSTPSGDGGSVYCQNCGTKTDADASFCPECGTEVVESADDSKGFGSSNWRYGLIAGIGLTITAVVVAGVFAQTEAGETGFALFFFAGWILFAVSMYYDTKYVQRTTEWTPRRVLWVGGMIVPYLNIVVSLVYLYRRRGYAVGTSADASAEPSAPNEQAEPEPARNERSESEPAPRTEIERETESEEPQSPSEPAPDRSEPDSEPTTTARVSQEQIYTEGGHEYVETPVGPDKRLYTDGSGNHYYRRGQAIRALYGGIAALSAAAAVFFIAFFPDAPGGPGSPRGQILFALVEAVPLGNVIVGIIAIWIAYRMASVAYEGREYVAIERPS